MTKPNILPFIERKQELLNIVHEIEIEVSCGAGPHMEELSLVADLLNISPLSKLRDENLHAVISMIQRAVEAYRYTRGYTSKVFDELEKNYDTFTGYRELLQHAEAVNNSKILKLAEEFVDKEIEKEQETIDKRIAGLKAREEREQEKLEPDEYMLEVELKKAINETLKEKPEETANQTIGG